MDKGLIIFLVIILAGTAGFWINESARDDECHLKGGSYVDMKCLQVGEIPL